MTSKTLSHKRRVRVSALLAGIALTVGLTATACTSSSTATSAQGAVDTSDSQAQTTFNEFSSAVPYPYTQCSGSKCTAAPPSDPLERLNLAARLKEYNSAGDTNYVYVFGFNGQVLGYYVIKGKVSSTGSEMTSTQQVTNCGTANNGDNGGCSVTDAIGDDGSYGPEEGGSFGVFFFTSTGTLVETDQPFMVSSTPIALYSSVPQLDK
jgi:hypothetical protein